VRNCATFGSPCRNPSLQYGYKENVRRSSMHLACLLLCFVCPSLQYCYKENVRRSLVISKTENVRHTFTCSPNEDFGSPNQPFRMCFPTLWQRPLEGLWLMHLACFLLCVVNCCKPILAILLQRKHQTIIMTIIMHLACWSCFL